MILWLDMQGASQTLAAPGPLARDPALCQEGAAQVLNSALHKLNSRHEDPLILIPFCLRVCQNAQWGVLPSTPRALASVL